MTNTAVDVDAPGQYLSIHCGNCKQASRWESCARDANGYTLPLSQWRCPRCCHQWALIARPMPDHPGRKYIVTKIIRQGTTSHFLPLTPSNPHQ